MARKGSRKSEQKPSGDIVLLTGAGASGYLGLPTLNNMLAQSRIFLDDRESSRIIRETYNAIQCCQVRQATFEELIARLRDYRSIASRLRTDFLFRKELGAVLADVESGAFERKWNEALTECYRILLDAYGPKKVDTQSLEFGTTLNLIEELAKLNNSSSKSLHLFTTNYDCSLQVLAANAPKLSFITHIDADGNFDKAWYADGDKPVPKSRKRQVRVHRLHGCIAWFYDERNLFQIEEACGAADDLDVNDPEKLHRMAIKLVTSQLVGTNPAFMLSFEELESRLREARALLIWGYSFRDLEVLRTINMSYQLRETPLLVYSLNPFLSENNILENIRSTLRDVPVRLHPKFKPRKIDWRPCDGHAALIEKTLKQLGREDS